MPIEIGGGNYRVGEVYDDLPEDLVETLSGGYGGLVPATDDDVEEDADA